MTDREKIVYYGDRVLDELVRSGVVKGQAYVEWWDEIHDGRLQISDLIPRIESMKALLEDKAIRQIGLWG